MFYKQVVIYAIDETLGGKKKKKSPQGWEHSKTRGLEQVGPYICEWPQSMSFTHHIVRGKNYSEPKHM
jgi:hypothetical protein